MAPTKMVMVKQAARKSFELYIFFIMGATPLIRAIVAQVVQTFVIDAECNGFVLASAGDFDEKNAVKICSSPIRHLRRIAAERLDYVLCKNVQQGVLPGDKNCGLMIWRLFKFLLQSADVAKTEFSIDWQAATDRSRFNSHERTHIIVLLGVGFLRGIGGEDKIGFSVIFQSTLSATPGRD